MGLILVSCKTTDVKEAPVETFVAVNGEYAVAYNELSTVFSELKSLRDYMSEEELDIVGADLKQISCTMHIWNYFKNKDIKLSKNSKEIFYHFLDKLKKFRDVIQERKRKYPPALEPEEEADI